MTNRILKVRRIHELERILQRNQGLDFARIIAMLGIITLHVLGQGGVLKNLHESETNYWIYWFIEIVAYCSVNVFAMLSGYLNCEKCKFSSSRILELICSLMFYTIGITIIFYCFYREKVSSIKDVIKSLFPMLAGRYWYITCFILVYYTMPFINYFIKQLSYEQCKKIGVIMFVLVSVVPSFAHTDFFAVNFGYSAMWLILCYYWGGIIKKRENEKYDISNSRCLFLYFLCLIIVLLARMTTFFVFGRGLNYMCSYTSPFIVMASVLLLLLAKNLFNKHSKINKVLMLFSNAAFDVYLLHCHILVYDVLLVDRFSSFCNVKIYLIPILLGLVIVSIYIVGTITYIIRKQVFKILKIDLIYKLAGKLVDKYLFVEL